MLSGFIPNYSGCSKWEVGGLCSGHGTCVDSHNNTPVSAPFLPGTSCRCHSSWNGNGLFINQHDQDCSLHEPTVFAFWLFALLVGVLCLIGVIRKVREFVLLLRKEKPNLTLRETLRELSGLAGIRVAVPSIIGLIFGFLTEINAVMGVYPGNTFYSTFAYVMTNFMSNLSQGYYATIVLPMSVNLVSMSVNDSERAIMEQIARASWTSSIPFLLIYSGAILSFAFLETMQRQHVAVIIYSLCPVIPIVFGGTRVATSSTIIAKILEETRRSQHFEQEVERVDTSVRLRGVAAQQKQAWVILFTFFGVLIAWPWFRIQMAYTLPWFFVLDALAQVSTVRIFAASAKGLAKDQRLEVFMRIVSDPHALEIFKEFLRRELSSENLLFWERVEEYRTLIIAANPRTAADETAPGKDSRIVVVAKNIYTDFIAESAVQTVNLSFENANKLRMWYSNACSSDPALYRPATNIDLLDHLYKDAQHEIFQLIRNDSLARFQMLPEFEALQARWQRNEIVANNLRTLSADVNEPKGASKGSKIDSRAPKGSRLDSPDIELAILNGSPRDEFSQTERQDDGESDGKVGSPSGGASSPASTFERKNFFAVSSVLLRRTLDQSGRPDQSRHGRSDTKDDNSQRGSRAENDPSRKDTTELKENDVTNLKLKLVIADEDDSGRSLQHTESQLSFPLRSPPRSPPRSPRSPPRSPTRSRPHSPAGHQNYSAAFVPSSPSAIPSRELTEGELIMATPPEQQRRHNESLPSTIPSPSLVSRVSQRDENDEE